MKKFLFTVLAALMLSSFGTFAEATQAEQENYCAQDNDEPSGEYCGRYGCGRK